MKNHNYKKSAAIAMILAISFSIFFALTSQSAHANESLHNVDVHIQKADLFYLQGKYSEAINEATKAITLNSNDPRGYNYIIAIHIANADYRKALDVSRIYLSVVEASDSLDLNAIIRHAALLEKSIGYQETIQFLHKYRKIFPRTVERDIEGLKKANKEGIIYYKIFP